jgi:hypothetical protein
MRVLLSRFLWPGLRRVLLRSRTLLAFLRGRALHLLDRTLHLRSRMLHLLDRSLHLRGGPLLGSRALQLLPGWRWVRLGGRPYLLDRSGMYLHRLDRALWLVWPQLLRDRLIGGPGDLPYGRDRLRLQVLHRKRTSHGHGLRLSAVH